MIPKRTAARSSAVAILSAAIFVSAIVPITGCGEQESTLGTEEIHRGEFRWSPDSERAAESEHSVNLRLKVDGGVAPYDFQLVGSGLPEGLTLGHSGVVAGSTPKTGVFPFNVQVSDAAGQTEVMAYTVQITPYQFTSGLPTVKNERALTDGEQAWLMASRELSRMDDWAKNEGLSIDPDNATLVIFNKPGLRFLYVPLLEDDGTLAWGAVYFIDPFTPKSEALSYLVFPDAVEPTIRYYGGSGDYFTDHFNRSRKWIYTDFVTGKGACGPTWEKIKEWFASDSPAEDLPWWYDLLCGVACGAALTGNPLAISGCVHCIGGYIAACVPVTAIGLATHTQIDF